jgi:hypothetical protein
MRANGRCGERARRATGGEPDFAPSFRLREATSGKPLWIVRRRPRDICLGGVHEPQISLNRRLPGTFQRVLDLSARRAEEECPNGTADKTARAVVPGSRLFNTIFDLPRTGKNITRPLGTI